MILVDYSNVSIAATSVALREGSLDQLSNGFLMGKLRQYNTKFREEFGELIICADHRSWREDEFQYYKARRRQVSEVDIDSVFKKMLEIRTEIYDTLHELSPYRCVKTKGAEGDDVMAVLSRHSGKHIIISADKDMSQLVSPDVKCWQPVKKEFTDNGPFFKRALVIGGDDGDDVPNILSDDDTFINPNKRQRAMRKNIREPLMAAYDVESAIYDLPVVKGISTEQIVKNYHRNVKLIDLEQIPDEVVNAINTDFDAQENKRGDFMNVFMRLRTSQYTGAVADFQPKKAGATNSGFNIF